MKTRFIIFGSLACIGAGVLYLFFRNQSFNATKALNHTGPIQHDDKDQSHIRQVLHKAKMVSGSPQANEKEPIL